MTGSATRSVVARFQRAVTARLGVERDVRLAKGRLAKRTVDGLICRLFLLGLSLAIAAAATLLAYRLARQPTALGAWAWSGVLLWISFGSAQWWSERRVDEANALSRLAVSTALRTMLPLVVIVAVDWFFQPGLVQNLAGFLLVAYVTGLLVSTWLTMHVVEQPAAASNPK